MSDKNQKEKVNDFEKSLVELEKLVGELESGNLSLDQSIKKFEIGVQLYKSCKERLSGAEKRIATLLESLKEEELTDGN